MYNNNQEFINQMNINNNQQGRSNNSKIVIIIMVFIIVGYIAYAKFIQNENNLNFMKTDYKITFNANGGSVNLESKNVKKGEKYGELPTPTRIGYKFIGWFTKKDAKFDSKYYANTYPNVANTYGNDYIDLLRHWFDYGFKEGKICSVDYRNSDSIYNNNDNETLYAIYRPTFDITHWWGIVAEYMDDTQIDYLKDAGFTLIWTQAKQSNTKEQYKQNMITSINKLNEKGLRVLVVPYQEIGYVSSQSEREELTREMVNDYSQYPNVYEYFVLDEPHGDDNFDDIGKLINIIHDLDPGRDGYTNLLPKEANWYKDLYVAPYARKVNMYTLSFDKYIFFENEVNKAMYYSNLKDIYDVAMDYNKIPMTIVLLSQFGNYKNVTRNEIAFQVSVSLAFGMKRISYFTYSVDGLASQNFKNALLDEKHNRTQHYYDVQSVNSWLYKLGSKLYDRKIKAIYGFNEVDNITNYSSNYKSISANKAGIVSLYDDNSFLLVNTEIYPEAQKNTFSFDSLNNLEWFNPSTYKWEKITGDINNEYFSISYNYNQIIINPGYCVLLKGDNYWNKI